jgi:hypothetical protein
MARDNLCRLDHAQVIRTQAGTVNEADEAPSLWKI